MIYCTDLGDSDFVVTLKESNAKFNFNFKDVYWNSRLQMEHSRLIDFITISSLASTSAGNTGNKNDVGVVSNKRDENANNRKKNNNKNNSDNSNSNIEEDSNINRKRIEVVVADMMAGVGPFAVPLAINGITVYANDLNPE